MKARDRYELWDYLIKKAEAGEIAGKWAEDLAQEFGRIVDWCFDVTDQDVIGALGDLEIPYTPPLTDFSDPEPKVEEQRITKLETLQLSTAAALGDIITRLEKLEKQNYMEQFKR